MESKIYSEEYISILQSLNKEITNYKKQKNELLNKLENKELYIYDLKMELRKNNIDKNKIIEKSLKKIEENSKKIFEIDNDLFSNRQDIIFNNCNIDILLSSFIKVSNEVENMNTKIKKLCENNIILNTKLKEYSSIENEIISLQNHYKEIVVQNKKEINDLLLDNKLLKYQNSKLENINKTIKNEIMVLQEENLCVICKTNKKNILFLPCKHYIICDECEKMNCNISNETKCPICRKIYNDTIKLFT